MTRLALAALLGVMLSACVTTTTGPFEDKKDLDQAVQTYIQIGYRHFENNNLYQAKQALNEALAIDDEASGAYLGLARVFEVEEELELAEQNFRRAIDTGGGTEAVFQYGVFLYNQQRYEEARDRFQEAAGDAFYERRAQSFEFLAISERRLGRIEAAIDAYQRAIVLDADNPNTRLGLAELRFDQGEAAGAWRAYNGFADLVRDSKADFGPYSLWLGIRIAHANGDDELQSDLAARLSDRFADSEEYRLYQSWREEA